MLFKISAPSKNTYVATYPKKYMDRKKMHSTVPQKNIYKAKMHNIAPQKKYNNKHG